MGKGCAHKWLISKYYAACKHYGVSLESYKQNRIRKRVLDWEGDLGTNRAVD